MHDAIGGFQPQEEWRTRALVVAWRASRAGEGGPGSFLLRSTRNPLGVLTDEEYDRFCKGRLTSVAALRDAALAEPDLFATVHESGRCSGGVFDVVDLPPATADDLVNRRLRPDQSALHRLIERVLDACAVLHERTGRGHGALTPAGIYLSGPVVEWTTAVRIGDAPAAAAPPDGPAADLRAIGRLMHLIATHREPDPTIFSDDGDASAFRCFGRGGVRHRRLCADLLTASPSRSDFGVIEARDALRSIRPASPGTRKAVRIGGGAALALVIVGGAAAAWVATRPEGEPLGDAPPKRQFDEAKTFALLLENALRRADDPALSERLATPEFQDAVGLLSVEALKRSDDFNKWFTRGRRRVENVGADHHGMIRWTISNVAAWEAAYDAAMEEVGARLIEPLREASAKAAAQGWSGPAREAQQMADRCAGLIERAELRALAETVDDAARLHTQLSGWFARLADARDRTENTLIDIDASGAMIVVDGAGEPRPAGEAARQWLDSLAQAQPGEAPEATIARFSSQSAVVLEQVADTAEYWSGNARFDRERFLAEGAGVGGQAFADAATGRDAFDRWQRTVRDSQFVNIGTDPRLQLFAKRDELRQQITDLVTGLTGEEMAIIQDRIDALEAQLATVEEPLDGVGEWSLENEQTVLDAVAVAGSRLAESFDRLAGAESYLEERANIELRRRGAISRAESLIEEFPGWFDAHLTPIVDQARGAEDDVLEPILDELANETQRLRAVSRDALVLLASVESVRGDNSTFGDVLRSRAATLLEEWRTTAVASPDDAAPIRATIERIVELRDGAAAVLASIDARQGPLTPDAAGAVTALAESLRSVGVDPAAHPGDGRLFQALVQLQAYIDTRGQWEFLRDRLAIDLRSGVIRTEVLWNAYEFLREAEAQVDPSLAIDDIELERVIRDRLVAAYEVLPDRLGAPTVPQRLDSWLAGRPATWATNADALADLAGVEQILPEVGGGGVQPHIEAARLLAEVVGYAPAEDAPDEEVRPRLGAFRARIADIRPGVPGDGDWYTLLGVADQRLADLEAGRGGPRLDLDLLATIGPGGAAWTLRPESTIERPVYERNGVTMGFALIEEFDPPFYMASDELSLEAFQQIARDADGPSWDMIAQHALLKDWGNAPDDDAIPNEIRGYWVTAQRQVELQVDWISPPAQVREGGVDWPAHRRLIYGEQDAARSQAWSPTERTPLHLIGFQGAWATASAAGCRLPSPEEWLAAYGREDLRQGAAPNVSDAAWLRQVQREQRGIPSPQARSFFGYGTRETPSSYDAEDDGWLWLRPIDLAPGTPALRDMVGNVAEWADALANERPPEFAAPSLADEDLEASARIVGISALSGAGEPDQVVTLSRSRRDRRANLLADVVRGGGSGFPDVGVRLAFGVGDAAPRSLAGRYAQTMEDLAAVISAGEATP
ncbi:MAG: SUMF1/EgtB/PvdO family nonheme iron enzyme [Phycisphaerales bacterium]